jgi:hypothetical protein
MHGQYLYTLPFHFNHLNNFINFDQIKASDDEFLNNNPHLWYNVTSVEFIPSCRINSNLLKLFKIKMPKLTSITLSTDHPYHSETKQHPNISENEEDKLDVTLDNVTTVCFNDRSTEDEKQWLIHALSNLTQLTLCRTELPSPKSQFALEIGKKIQCLNITLGYKNSKDGFMQPDHFSNLEYLNITAIPLISHESLRQCANYVIYLLKNVKKMKILSICFTDLETPYTHRGDDRSASSFAGFNFNEIMKSYEMTHFFHYIKFSKKI